MAIFTCDDHPKRLLYKRLLYKRLLYKRLLYKRGPMPAPPPNAEVTSRMVERKSQVSVEMVLADLLRRIHLH